MKSRHTQQASTLALPTFYFHSLLGSITSRFRGSNSLSDLSSRFNRRRFSQVPWKKYVPIIILILIVVGVLVIASRTLPSLAKPNNDARLEMKNALATTSVGKTLNIPVLDSKGEVVTNTTYTIESAELREEIIVQSRRMVAIKGRMFLILNIKLVNEYDKQLEIKAADYVRLSVNNNETELFAPEIHNDPVLVQAISTKDTRVGFPIYDTDKNIVLLVGQISEEKEKIPLQF